jgi:hypothetical protein
MSPRELELIALPGTGRAALTGLQRKCAFDHLLRFGTGLGFTQRTLI